MIITAVDVVRVTVPAYDPPFVWRAGLPGSEPEVDGAWLVIRTDAGITGLAFALRGAILQDVVDRRIRAELVGRDPIAREYLWERVWELDRIERFPVFVQGVVDVALWDLAGKAVGLPVYKLLGFVPRIDSGVRLDGHLRVDRGVPRRRRPVPRARLSRDQAARLGRRAQGRPARRGAARARRPGRPAHVRRLGRLRPARRDLPRQGAQRGGLPLVRGADARVQRHRLPAAGGAGAMCRCIVAEVAEGSHMKTADFIAAGCAAAVRTSTDAARRLHRRDAHRPPGGRVPAARRGARPRRRQPPPVHVDQQHHLLRVAHRLEPGAGDRRRRRRPASCTRRPSPVSGSKGTGSTGRRRARRRYCRKKGTP